MFRFKAKRTLLSGMKSLWLHRLRSGLTMLGITFGVSSVIAMLAIGEGASREAQRQIKSLGPDNIIIQSVEPPPDSSTSAKRTIINQYGLTYQDAERVRDTIPGIEVDVPARRIHRRASSGPQFLDADLVGTVPWYADVRNEQLVDGRFLSALDMNGNADVCVLGSHVAQVLFPFGDAIGSTINVVRFRYRVVGILSAGGQTDVGGKKIKGNPNSEIYIPLTTLQSQFGRTIATLTSGAQTIERIELHEFTVQVGGVGGEENLDRVIPTQKAIEAILSQSHKKQDYQIIVPLELLQRAKATQRIFSIVLGSIAAISLLVGGIGIMNITLATVMERTREIGIRRAMGAKKRDIVLQFLSETTMLAMFGGTVGVVLGVVVPFLVSQFTSMPTEVTLLSLILAFGISATVGLLFGIYPAYRAANMDPIEALRHE